MAFDPKLARKEQSNISIEKRRTTFLETVVPFSIEEAKQQANRCLNCPKPNCVVGCPLNLPIPQMISLLKEDKIAEAKRIIDEISPLNGICSIICNQEAQCEGSCIRKKAGSSVNIGAIHRFIAFYSSNISNKPTNTINKKIAVIGAGPSGLSCAYELYCLGYQVDVYEKEDKLGGIPYYEIPEFRLNNDNIGLLNEFFNSTTINFYYNSEKNVTDLLDKYDAIYIAIGTQLSRPMGILGEVLPEVFKGEEFLKDIKYYHNVDKYKSFNKVVVVGAGNVAMDVSRTLIRLNKDVNIVYRRSIEEAPCARKELLEAKEEGVKLNFLTNPVAFLGQEHLKKIRLIKMELGEVDASGRRSPVEIKGSEYEIEADAVFLALGSSLDNSSLTNISLERRLIKVNEHYQTNIDKVFAGGDAVTGPKTVVHAVKAGIEAAKEINNYLAK